MQLLYHHPWCSPLWGVYERKGVPVRSLKSFPAASAVLERWESLVAEDYSNCWLLMILAVVILAESMWHAKLKGTSEIVYISWSNFVLLFLDAFSALLRFWACMSLLHKVWPNCKTTRCGKSSPKCSELSQAVRISLCRSLSCSMKSYLKSTWQNQVIEITRVPVESL